MKKINKMLVTASLCAAAGMASAKNMPFPVELQKLQHQTFNFFWETANLTNGLVPDRYPSESFSSIAAVGYGLTAYPVGVQRGYVTRQQAAERTLTTLNFLYNAPQCAEAVGCAGYKGFFYRYLDMRTGVRTANVELSSVDTALLMGGVLFAGQYFTRNNPTEQAIRDTADKLFRRVDWRWMQPRPPSIAHGWMPNGTNAPTDLIVSSDGTGETDKGKFLQSDWRGYNEASLVYILGLGSPTHPSTDGGWAEWTKPYAQNWGTLYGQTHLTFTPMFGHHYTHTWVDFKGIQDPYMRSKGMDYFENTRRATLAQRQYSIENPKAWKGYDALSWGMSASDGPADLTHDYQGQARLFRTYSARGVGIIYTDDDGTLAPTAAGGSVPFAPEVAIPTLQSMIKRYGSFAIGKYGFYDAFNPSFTFTDVPLHHGHLVEGGKGWVDNDYLGIDQGPIVVMFENYRSGLVWNHMRKNPYIQQGLKSAGFTGGWLDKVSQKP